MSTTRSCRCGHQWDAAEGDPTVCPACGAYAPFASTQALAPDPGVLGTDPGATASGSPRLFGSSLPAPAGFEVLGVLGRGGMGTVYKARDRKLGRLVAIKTLLSGPHASPELLHRFRIEAVTVARLEHPNIVQLHAVCEDGG